MDFKLGDKVQWSSQAGGVSKEKEGNIELIIHPNVSPRFLIIDLCERHNAISNYGGGFPRKEKSYVVLVERIGKSGKRLTPHVYWPNASQLSIAEQ